MEAGQIKLAIKAWSGMQNELRWFRKAALVRINEDAEDFYFRAATVLAAIKVLPETDLNRVNLINALNKAINATDFRRPGSPEFYGSIAQANAGLKADLAALQEEAGKAPTIVAVGHSHIDVAWLWRLKHTREKSSRTFSTVDHLMEQYPEYQFPKPAPAVRLHKGRLSGDHAKIKERVKDGRWELTGGMWVEADCNVTSGESLVRQFLLARSSWKKSLGCASILWLPDVFGYSGLCRRLSRRAATSTS